MMQRNLALGDPYGLLRVADAWRNGPALATLLITFVAIVPLGLLGLAHPSSSALPVTATLCIALAGLGVTAAASQFAEQADGRPVSSVAHAFVAAPRIVLRCALLASLLAAVFVSFVLLAAVVLFACRLPVVGSVLYAVALPVLTIAGAALLLAMTCTALLALPALWEGHSLRTALSQLCAIAAQRGLPACANPALFVLVAALVAAVVSTFVVVAFGLIAGLAVPVSGTIPAGEAFARLAGEAPLVGADPRTAAASVGAALVLAIMAAPLVAIFLFGLALAYRRSTDGIDIAVARVAFARAIIELQVKKRETIEEARMLVRRALGAGGRAPERASVRLVFPTVEAPTGMAAAAEERSALACAYCSSTARPGDVYCGHCGHRLSSHGRVA